MICKAKRIFLKAALSILLAPLTVFGGSYDAEQGDPIEVVVDQINGADRFGMEFFVMFHGQPTVGQVFIDRSSGGEGSDVLIEAEVEPGGLLLSAHVEPFTTLDQPLELFLGSADIAETGFNWLFVGFDGQNFILEWSNMGTVLVVEKAAVGTFHSSPQPFVFGSGGSESSYTLDEVYFTTEFPPIEQRPPPQPHGPTAGAVLLWHFDEMGGNTVLDASEYHNDGFIDGQGVWEEADAFEGGGPGPGGEGGIGVNVHLNEDFGWATVRMDLYFPGQNQSQLFSDRGEQSPSPAQGWYFEFRDPSIGPNTGPYRVRAWFDENNNGEPDAAEPIGEVGNFNTDNQSWAQVDLHMSVGGGGPGPVALLEINNVSVGDAIEGEDIDISVGIASEAGINQAELIYLLGGSTSPRNVSLSGPPEGGDWDGIIPGSDVTNRGLVGFIRVEDNPGQIVTSDTTEITVEFAELFLPNSTSAEVYQMVSAPGDLDAKVFDTLNDQVYDKSVWRMFRWNGSDYTEYAGNANLSPGTAYWIITAEAEGLEVGSGSSTRLMPHSSVSFSSGWNQIGSPYNFSIDLGQDVKYDPGSIEPTLYKWNGSSYSEMNNMQPGEGYWLYAYQSGSIKVGPGAGTLARRSPDIASSVDWSGKITASVGHLSDASNVFGVSQEASDGWDEADRHEPPVIGDYISLSFDNRHWDYRGGLYGKDMRNVDSEGQQWPFVVKTNQDGIVHLDFDWSQELPADWGVYLVDKALGIVHDLREDPYYSVACNCIDESRPFVLVSGPPAYARSTLDDYAVVPEAYTLSQNMPNPFNAVTTLKFSLPEESQVSLTVYDVLGHEVTTLISEEAYRSGHHALIWDGRDSFGREVSTGIYLYHLSAMKNGRVTFQDARKLVLLK